MQRGSSWQTVATVSQDRQGRAQFAARASRNGQALTYRVKAVELRGLPAIMSSTVSTERWLTPTWTDEFSGDSLSKNVDPPRETYEPQSLRRCSRGDAEAVRVGGGAVRLSVLRDRSRLTTCPALRRGRSPAGTPTASTATSAPTRLLLQVRRRRRRIKFPRLRGQHGSFWMQPVGGMYPGGTGHEIDVIEFFGEASAAASFSYIHRYEGGRIVKTGANIPDTFLHGPRDGWGKNFHVFSVQWTPRSLIFRIDGKETWRIGGRISRVPQYLILSLLSSDYELPEDPGPSASPAHVRRLGTRLGDRSLTVPAVALA